MKKIFLIVAVLMLATPALAVDVDVWAEQGDDVNKVEIWYEVYNPVPADCNDGNRPRAFGLNITVTDGNIIDINVPFEGECDDVNRGYGIFPGTISIVDGEVTGWGGPIAPDDAPGAEDTGIDTNTIVVEMGSLYTDDNCPDPCAMLFYIVVNMDCNVTIVGNAARTGTGSGGRGVVLENLAETIANFPEAPFEVRNVSRWVPDVVGLYQPDACDAIVAEDLVVGDITYECNDTYAYDYVIGQVPEAGTEVEQGTEVHLTKSLGPCDWGDANDPPYPTLSANNGAVHIATGVILGVNRDTEPDGQPSPNADLDDNTGVDDEDGITQLVITPVGGFVTVTVTADCNLNAWIDFNDNGDWDDPGEQIFTDESLLLAGSPHPLLFAVPAYAVRETDLVSRWRVNYAGGLSYTGLADDGEVEDHLAEVVCHVPDVVNEPNLAARAELIANGFTIGNVTAECNDVIPDGNVISTNPAYCNYPGCDTAVNMVVSTGPCPPTACFVPNVVDMTQADANAAIDACDLVVGNITTECNDTIADGNVISTNPAAGAEAECGSAVNIVVSTGTCVVEECFPSGHDDYAMWLKAGSPPCWCPDANGGSDYQCKGDTDGLFDGKNQYGKRQWVTGNDYNILVTGWQQFDGPNGEVGSWICADFGHDFDGKDQNGKRQWVTGNDYNILVTGWQVFDNNDVFTQNPCFP